MNRIKTLPELKIIKLTCRGKIPVTLQCLTSWPRKRTQKETSPAPKASLYRTISTAIGDHSSGHMATILLLRLLCFFVFLNEGDGCFYNYIRVVTRYLKSGNTSPGSGIKAPESGITYPGSGIKAPESGITDPGSGIKAPVSGITDPGCGIESHWIGSANVSGIRDQTFPRFCDQGSEFWVKKWDH